MRASMHREATQPKSQSQDEHREREADPHNDKLILTYNHWVPNI